MSPAATKKRKRTPPYKGQQQPTDVSGAVEEAMGEFQSLRDEMGEWRDNMSGGNMEHLDKFQEVESAADTLDSFADDSPDVPEALAGLACIATIMVPTRKGRGTSRAMRCSNGVSLLQAAVDALDEHIETSQDRIKELEDEITEHEGDRDEAQSADPPDEDAAADAEAAITTATEEKDRLESEVDEAETLKGELEEIIQEADGVEFPGMY